MLDVPRPDGRTIVSRLAHLACSYLRDADAAALVLVGGETAYHVLAELGHPRLRVVSAPTPLAVRAVIEDGALAGMPVVTKGGSSGPGDRLTRLVEELLHG